MIEERERCLARLTMAEAAKRLRNAPVEEITYREPIRGTFSLYEVRKNAYRFFVTKQRTESGEYSFDIEVYDGELELASTRRVGFDEICPKQIYESVEARKNKTPREAEENKDLTERRRLTSMENLLK